MSEVKFGFNARDIIREGHVAEDDLRTLRDWLSSTDLPKLNDEQLVLFLISTNNDVEVCKGTVENYFRCKTAECVLFRDRNVLNEDLRRIAGVGYFAVLPERYQGSSLFLSSFQDTNYRNFDTPSFLKMNCMVLESVLQDENPQDSIYIIDVRGFSFMHIFKLNLHVIPVYFNYIQTAIPLITKNLHILYANRALFAAFNIIKPWLHKDLATKVVFHAGDNGMRDFYEKWIPKRYFPKEIGGDLGSIKVYHERTMRKVRDLQHYFDAEEKQRTGHR
ncbi:hypothetical protein PPYR_03194 [Photinus pyralis]|nr:uncharacterized protein LOC116161384 [Photinus pyralis]XP_031330578.1 uncharacterized protein LOC116161384 [Photinus pyralis]XP_031351153.1 uncharacterized protein LOC116176639 [Photinus pyralis]KAB0791394.1 hypothetical protein PPYR_03194 [Photinus pyralis]